MTVKRDASVAGDALKALEVEPRLSCLATGVAAENAAGEGGCGKEGRRAAWEATLLADGAATDAILSLPHLQGKLPTPSGSPDPIAWRVAPLPGGYSSAAMAGAGKGAPSQQRCENIVHKPGMKK